MKEVNPPPPTLVVQIICRDVHELTGAVAYHQLGANGDHQLSLYTPNLSYQHVTSVILWGFFFLVYFSIEHNLAGNTDAESFGLATRQFSTDFPIMFFYLQAGREEEE